MAEKKISKNTFEGGINTVIAKSLQANNTLRYALNCHSLSTAAGDVGVITNVKGNTLVSIDLPEGENKVVGYAKDEERNKFYYFLWNINNLHTIYEYDAIQNKIVPILQSITDSNGVDILRFAKSDRILHADVIRGNILTWCHHNNPARKVNIDKLKDKSEAGYGTVVLEEYINAYKVAPTYAPKATYFTDSTKTFNRLYGRLVKFASRFIYDDGEVSNWSEYSTVPLPYNESFTGVKYIPKDNNGIKITLETGSRIVVKIEIAAVFNSLEWVSIATLDKKQLQITNNSEYVYSFYNDGSYLAVDPLKIVRPYSFLPKNPHCQAFVKNAMVYFRFPEGFPTVNIDTEISVAYNDLYIESGVDNQYNKPSLILNSPPTGWTGESVDYWAGYEAKMIDGSLTYSGGRAKLYQITIGVDVKKGNPYQIFIRESGGGSSINIGYTAILSDTASSVANELRKRLIETNKLLSWTEKLGTINVYEDIYDGFGNVSFKFIISSFDRKHKFGYPELTGNVEPVQYGTLKDNGLSIQNIKLGSATKFGFVYYDADGRKSLTYTNANMTVYFKTVNELGGIKHPVVTIQAKHYPPKWAKHYEIVRSQDLTAYDFLQMLIQKVNDVNETETGEYLDLIAGSLTTYQRAHENTILKYDFQKGDRLRFIKRTDTAVYYPPYETEILSYKDSTEEEVNSNIKIDGSTKAFITGVVSVDNIGKYIIIDGNERLITAVEGNDYVLNSPIGVPETPATYSTFKIVDRRGVVRIRKPDTNVIQQVYDASIVEFYKPYLASNLSSKQFFSFGKKFPILNWGTDQAYHSGSYQNQSGAQPAIITIEEGTTYVRQRELPVTNVKPAQVIIEPIEDPNYSDFYESNLTDNGKENIEDDGSGEVYFGDRARWSTNFIEDTKINGLNDFDNLNRKDFIDQYGSIERVHFSNNRLYLFKHLIDAWVPVYGRVIRDQSGQSLLAASDEILGDIEYFAFDGGIGNNPESLSWSGDHLYHASANSGSFVRIGGNGVIPISKVFNIDKTAKDILKAASEYGAEILSGVDEENGEVIFAIEGYDKLLYANKLYPVEWETSDPAVTISLINIITQPANGTLAIDGLEITYTPNNNYLGTDGYTYSVISNGVALPARNVCIDVKEQFNRPTYWRGKESTAYCVLDVNQTKTGFKGWATLEQVYVDNSEFTGNEKPNVQTDGDYQSPIQDVVTCVVENSNPQPYSFTTKFGAELNSLVESNQAAILGINTPSPISASAGAEYRVNAGPWTSVAGFVENNDFVQVRGLSSSSYDTLSTVRLTVGNYTADFNFYTKQFVAKYRYDTLFENRSSYDAYELEVQIMEGNEQVFFETLGARNSSSINYFERPSNSGQLDIHIRAMPHKNNFLMINGTRYLIKAGIDRVIKVSKNFPTITVILEVDF